MVFIDWNGVLITMYARLKWSSSTRMVTGIGVDQVFLTQLNANSTSAKLVTCKEDFSHLMKNQAGSTSA